MPLVSAGVGEGAESLKALSAYNLKHGRERIGRLAKKYLFHNHKSEFTAKIIHNNYERTEKTFDREV
ncbi:MAG: hypothetical protein COT17_05960 [Elusimicrobia bacterium CG08_land_8_20_14_0_20_51_18]|nr:MAG: hypothetical protein COT17_05960 [Elusimicrobia bacterium CG08_land_8_20_14_0_20_51_18]